MAYYKDPTTGEIYDEATAGNKAVRAAQSKLIFIPFRVPYQLYLNKNPYLPQPADIAAMNNGLIASNAKGSAASTLDASLFGSTWPYDAPPTPGTSPNWKQANHGSMAKNDNEYNLFGQFGDAQHASKPWENLDLIRSNLFSIFVDRRVTFDKEVAPTIDQGTTWTTQQSNTNWKIEETKSAEGNHSNLINSTLYTQTLQVNIKDDMSNEPDSPAYKLWKLIYMDREKYVWQGSSEGPTLTAAGTTSKVGGDNGMRYPQELRGDANFMANKSFRDATFVINKPSIEYAYSEQIGEDTGYSDPVKVKAYYNFYLQPYESVVNTFDITSETTNGSIPLPETALPNIYTLMSDLKEGSDIDATYQYADQWGPAVWASGMVDKHNKKLQRNLIKKLNSSGNRTYFNTIAASLVKQQKVLAPWADNWSTSNIGQQVDTKRYYTTGIASNKIKDFMDEADKTKKHFPMYVDIEIPAYNKGTVGEILYRSSLSDQFMQLVMAAYHPRRWATDTQYNKYYWECAVVRKDSVLKEAESGAPLVKGEHDELYRETLANLWLNDFLQNAEMPNLDKEAPGTPVNPDIPSDMASYHTRYWYNNDPAAKNALRTLNKEIDFSFLKPVVFGKSKGSSLSFVNNIKWALFKKKLFTFIENNIRSVKDIYDGKTAYSEVLFYEIVKYRSATDSNGKPKHTFVQNIFLPNVPGMEALKYIDTQVKFGSEYYYQVYAHTFVVGTHYQMTDLNFDRKGHLSANGAMVSAQAIAWGNGSGPQSGTGFPLKYKYAPSIYLVRAPYYNTYITMGDTVEAKLNLDYEKIKAEGGTPNIYTKLETHPENLEKTPIWDSPPVFPDAVFLPLRGEKNKILLNTNFNVGEYDLEPVFIDEGETVNLDKIRKNQKKMKGKITFKGDDFCGQIEVLRIDKKPFSYADFAPVENTRIAILGGTAAFGHIDDTLMPNKDYYYVVRAKDIHGNYSNPSPVYQARIVTKDGEVPYTVFNMFFIEELERKEPSSKKNLMKYIKIQPSFNQTHLNDAAITSLDSVQDVTETIVQDNLGSADKTVFGQQFKIRFTSKKTGKKFDLNLFVKPPRLVEGDNQSSAGELNKYGAGKC